MASLSSGIKTQIQAQVAPETLADMTRQRSSETTPDDAVLTAAADSAAAEVEGYLGDEILDADIQAVNLGVQLMIIQLQIVYSAMPSSEGRARETAILDKLDRLARSRVGATNWASTTVDHAKLDRRYPGTIWGDGGDTDGSA